MLRLPTVVAATWAMLGTMACIDEPSVHTAYEDQRFLCAAEHDATWAGLIEDCRVEAAGTCGGHFSMTGVLQGENVTIESKLTETVFFVEEDAGGERTLARLDLAGAGPYFLLQLKLKSVGGSASNPATATRALTWDGAAEAEADHLLDTLIEGSLRISNGQESDELITQTNSGGVSVDVQSAEELAASFDGAFGADGSELNGCLHVFPTQVRIVSGVDQ